MAATLQTFHGVDILVSNAGIVRAADFLDMAEADFDEVVRVNLKGVFLVSLCPACCVPGLSDVKRAFRQAFKALPLDALL